MVFDIYEFFSKLNEKKVNIRLDAGDPDIQPNKEILDELTKNINKLNYAPYRGLDELREKIADYHKVDKNEVIITPGSKAAISSLIFHSKNLGLISPFWSGYEIAARLYNKKISIVNTKIENFWEPDFSKVSDIDTLIINYPNNPTGKMLSLNKIKELIDISNNKKITLISDEAYRDIVFNGFKFKLTDYKIENSVSIFSFSKTFSLPGLRLGYAVGDKMLINKIGEFIKANYTSVPIFAQKAGIKALDMWDKIGENTKDIYKKRVDLFISSIKKDHFDFTYPDGTFYVFLKIKRNISGTDISYKLIDKNIGVFPGEAFGYNYKNYIRISLTTREDNIIKAAYVINEVIENY
ncbi:MAG: pyridoxal phosphate-dependent aminotransferase [Caldisphaera sp.]|jgi:aspartate aminotransferase|nr:pyridoxal phosphate-dependent aminotransferase [Caldisphaera sp.]PMP92051.1 MAG: aspartate aminotransferase [Caldisphaera sp.]